MIATQTARSARTARSTRRTARLRKHAKSVAALTSACAVAGMLSLAPAASAESCDFTDHNMYCESIMGWISCDYDSAGKQIDCDAGTWTKRNPRPMQIGSVKAPR